MRKLLVVVAFVAAEFWAIADAQTVPTARVASAIHDPDEAKTYAAALAIADPAQRAMALENFVDQYPQSTARADALDQAMVAYQQLGNKGETTSTARRILAFDSENVPALAVVVAVDRVRATEFPDGAIAESLKDEAAHGLDALPRWRRPEGVSDTDFAKLRDRMAVTFEGALGYALLQTRDYAAARDHYRVALAANPDDMDNVYQMGTAEIDMQPIDVDGFWYVARAAVLARAANTADAAAIESFGKAKYHAFHGGDDGWDGIAAAATQTSPPANFAAMVVPAPPPAVLAMKMAGEPDPSKLSFDDWEFILSFRDVSPENKQAADKFWRAIQAKQKGGVVKLKLPITVIGAYGDEIDGALSDKSQKNDAIDAQITMKYPLAELPDNGTALTVMGRLVDYVPKPFSFIVREGELAPASAAK